MGESLNFISFNQDGSCIAIGTSLGYKIFNCDPFGKCYTRSDGGIGIVEMLFSTSLIAIAGIGDQPAMSPRRLKIINSKRHSTICELTFPTSVLAVKMNKSRLVVLLEEQIYVYDIHNMRLLHTIETAPNPNGLCALSPTTDTNYLVYPSPPKPIVNPVTNVEGKEGGYRQGDVIVFNAQTLQPVVVIEAHKTTVAAIAMSYDGTLLATASDKGTIVRVFSVDTGVKLYQFRRGTYPTKIYSLSFSKDNKYLTASSATETVHIFKLGEELELIEEPVMGLQRGESSGSDSNERRVSNGSFDSINSQELDVEPVIDISRRTVGRMIRKSSQSIGRRAAERIGTFLPPKLTSMLEPNRHFASLKVPAANGVKNVVYVGQEISVNKGTLPAVFDDAEGEVTLLHVLVVSSEGYFYSYGLDAERGGDCILLNQYLLVD